VSPVPLTAESASEKTRVFVVDDDPATRKLLERQLVRAGYSVQTFADGRAALAAVGTRGCGIVITDWDMPGMTGLELCRAVRELEELQTLGDVYFLLLTAHSSKDDLIRGLEAGANDYLTKPYHHGELLARVRVGERVITLQRELRRHTLEVQKTNAQMALLARKLEQLANTDTLTQLPNRRHLFEQLADCWHAAESGAQPLSCVLLDIDRFKTINDTLGHGAGDEVLKVVAAVILGHARRSEHCGRLGGEEFVVLLPGLELAEAATEAERLRVALAAQPLKIEGKPCAVTVSCGVATRSAATACPDDMIRAADAAMYAAKQNGRNQVWACDPAEVLTAVTLGVEHRPQLAGAELPKHPVSRCRDRAPPEGVESGHADSDHQR
jgi:diguanylate cyclase (GGDEF)-like protein